MNYTLAKKLKEARYPQNVYIPTLSELIEACPKTISPKGQTCEFFLRWSEVEQQWHAGYEEGHEYDFPYGEIGEIPEEAVANLWLALNKKPPTT